MSAGRRLFFALWPDDAVRDALVRWQRRCLPGGASTSHRDDLHMTLHFLGQVEDRRIAGLLALGETIQLPGFEMRFDHLGHFSRPRVLWAGIQTEPAGLLALHGQLDRRLRELGFDLESRPYRPHVTLARKVREKPNVTDLAVFSWQVRRWALVESRSGRRPLYEPLAVWSLAGK